MKKQSLTQKIASFIGGHFENKTLRYLYGAGIGTILGTTALAGAMTKTNLYDGKIPVEVKSSAGTRTIEAPVFNPLKLSPLHCAAYARMTAKQLYGLKFNPADAWNYPYHNEQVAEIQNSEDLERLEKQGLISEGCIVGIYNPTSPNNKRLDEKGNPVKYTHVAVYLGRNPQTNEMQFAHQYGAKTKVNSLSELTKTGLQPKAVFKTR